MKIKKILALSVATSIALLAHAETEFNRLGLLNPVVSIGGASSSATLNQVSVFIADQLANNRDIKNVSDSRIAVASFVTIGNLEETNTLGMSLAENLMHEMHVRGFGVVDFKSRESLKIKSNGDFVFSRDVNELRRQYNIHYFLSGTMNRNGDGVVINARLIQADTGLVVSSAQSFIANRDLKKILNEQNVYPGEKIVIERPAIPPVRANTVNLR